MMNKREKAKLIAEAEVARGKRTRRYVNIIEIETMEKLDRKPSLKGKTIRVYSEEGFVPNSYKYQSSIDFVERDYDANGKKRFYVGSTSANRCAGNGALITVNQRAYG